MGAYLRGGCLMMPFGHAAVSAVVAGGIWAASGDWLKGAVAFAVGVLVDLDHIPEFTLLRGQPFRLNTFVRACAESRAEKMYLVLHGWEYLIAIVIAAFLLRAPMWGVTLAAPYFAHLVCDQFGNPVTVNAYWITYRWRHNFAAWAIINESSPVLAARRARYGAHPQQS